MTPKIFNFLFGICTVYAEFYADFKSVELVGKKCTQQKFFCKNLLQVSCIEEDKLQLCTLFFCL